jgi:hypothetical protein
MSGLFFYIASALATILGINDSGDQLEINDSGDTLEL